MERIDFNKLRTVSRDRTSSTRNVKDSMRCYPEYNAVVSNYIVKHNHFKEKESALHIMSMQNWIMKKEIQTARITPDYGQIWITDLGNNYMPECSYPHPVVIIEMIGNMVYIVPSTTSPQLVNDAYHPIDNPRGNKFYRKVGTAEGFADTSALILSNVRSISQGRLLDYKGDMTGVNDKSSVFWEVKDKCFTFCFPKKNIEIYNLNQRITNLETENNDLLKEIKSLNEQLQQKDEQLQQKDEQLQQKGDN